MEYLKDIVSILWLVFTVVAFFILLPQLKTLIFAIIRRIEKGGGLKIPGVELSELKYDSQSSQPEQGVIQKTTENVAHISPEVLNVILQERGDQRTIIVTNSILRLRRLTDVLIKTQQGSLKGLLTGVPSKLPGNFDDLPLAEKIHFSNMKTDDDLVKDLRYIDKVRETISSAQLKDYSNEEYIKKITGSYYKIERIIDYFTYHLYGPGGRFN